MVNDTIRIQRSHRSIRAFTDEPVADDVIDVLMDVVAQAPTSSFYQQRTVIRVADPSVREAIRQASGQPYVGALAVSCSSSWWICIATPRFGLRLASTTRCWNPRRCSCKESRTP